MNEISAYLQKHQARHLEELKELLRIPSVSTSKENEADVRRAAQWLVDELDRLGFDTEMRETARHPVVYAENLDAGPDAPTVLVYGHYDVQPPDPLDLWTTGPFDPTVRDEKLYARGATDDKGQMFTHIKAAEAHLSVNGSLPVNLKLLIEGEEEIGSPNLAPYVTEHREELAADMVVISDTSMFAPGLPAIVYGLRGLTYFEVECKGPSHDLHSGLYGGSVANPINALCHIIASLKDEGGRITVPGFYDDVRPLTEVEREEWAALPFDEEAFRAGCGASVMSGEEGYTTLERRWGRPTLDCNGVWGGFTGQGAKTVLPSKATAKFSCRLVPDQDFKDIEAKMAEHLQTLAPEGIEVEVRCLHGGEPVIIDISGEGVQAARKALSETFGKDAVLIRSGGSIPVVSDFSKILKIPVVMMGFGLPDDRLHSPDEKIDLACYFGGIQASAAFLSICSEK